MNHKPLILILSTIKQAILQEQLNKIPRRGFLIESLAEGGPVTERILAQPHSGYDFFIPWLAMIYLADIVFLMGSTPLSI